MLMGPRVSAAIVLYHSGARVLETVKCVQNSQERMALYIVDNSPEELTSRRILMECPEAIILPQKKNVGFGRGHNAVMQKLRTEYHLLLNPDITFEPDLLGRMVDFMEEHKEVSILTPRVFNKDGTEQFLPRRAPTVRYLLGGRLGGHSRYFQRMRQEYTYEGSTLDVPMEVQYATGCFLLIRTKLFYKLGGFDERYFLYHEDSDLSQKVLQMGGHIVYHPDFCVTHDWRRDSAHSLKALGCHVRSTVQYFNKWGWKW